MRSGGHLVLRTERIRQEQEKKTRDRNVSFNGRIRIQGSETQETQEAEKVFFSLPGKSYVRESENAKEDLLMKSRDKTDQSH